MHKLSDNGNHFKERKYIGGGFWRFWISCFGVVAGMLIGGPGCSSHDFGHSVGTEKISFNQRWSFHHGALDSTQVFIPDQLPMNGLLDTAKWYNVILPHDWSIYGGFAPENDRKLLPSGIGWYRKVFSLPEEDRYKHIALEFDGVYPNCTVWINGHQLGEQPLADVGFSYSLSKYLYFDDRSNVLVVKVDNQTASGNDWYNGSGINRNVWLIKSMPVTVDDHQSYFQVSLKMPHYNDSVPSKRKDGTSAVLSQDLVIDNKGMPALNEPADPYEQKRLEADRQRMNMRIQIKTTIYDANNFQVAQKTGSVKALPGRQHVRWSFDVKDINLWSPTNPYLYTWEVELRQGSQLIDRVRKPLGFRDVRFDSLQGLVLNGVPTKIRGVCLGSEWGAMGTAYNYSAMARQLKMLKDMGANAIRTVHQVPPPELLTLCDSMGFMVMDEAFDNWGDSFKESDSGVTVDSARQRQLSDFIKRDREHPSVILWSLGETGGMETKTAGVRLAGILCGIIRGLDSTRPVSAAMEEIQPGKNKLAGSGILDVLGFNYNSQYYDSLPFWYPGQSFIATRTANALQTRAAYGTKIPDSARTVSVSEGVPFSDTVDTRWSLSAYDLYTAKGGATHEQALLDVKNAKFLAGSFVWTGFDYLGARLPFSFPARSSYSGIIDLAGLYKDVYFLYQSEWADMPVLHLFPHWNWKEGDTVTVWAYYSQADDVELRLNGVSLGKKSKGDGKPGDSPLHVSWRVPFEAGKLEAIARKDGQTVAAEEVNTAGVATRLMASVDQAYFRGMTGDLLFVTVRLTDEHGTLVTNDDRDVVFSVKGPAVLAGLNNGYQADNRSLKGDTMRTWKGKVVALIAPKVNKGQFELEMQASGMEAQRMSIQLGE